jgi:hypothetical protein
MTRAEQKALTAKAEAMSMVELDAYIHAKDKLARASEATAKATQAQAKVLRAEQNIAEMVFGQRRNAIRQAPTKGDHVCGGCGCALVDGQSYFKLPGEPPYHTACMDMRKPLGQSHGKDAP